MKTLYLPPESESISLQTNSIICQSIPIPLIIDEGAGTIDPVTELDLSSDEWSVIL